MLSRTGSYKIKSVLAEPRVLRGPLYHGSRRDDSSTSSHSSPYAWMITFSDLMLLLLTLFALRLSVSDLDGRTLNERLSQFNRQKQETSADSASSENILLSNELALIDPQVLETAQELVTALADGLRQALGEAQAPETYGGVRHFSGGVELKPLAQGFLLELGGSSVSAEDDELSFKAAQSVNVLAKVLAGRNVQIKISGHIGEDSMEGALPFRSKWDSSLKQALRVSRQMIDAGVGAGRISVMGYGDSKPAISISDAKVAEAKRRIEIQVTVPEK